MELTKNEREILKLMLDNCRISDTAVAKKLMISPQAVGKIRKGLEKKGVIRGYSCELDFEAMGITTFALICAKIVAGKEMQSGEAWKKKAAAENALMSAPNLIMFAEPIGSEYNYVVLFGFSNQKEMEDFVQKARMVYAGILEDRRIDTFSARSLRKFDKAQLFRAMLERGSPQNPLMQSLDKVSRIKFGK
ncbi:Winged helix-turn-helix DNA-binding protein [Candidatus Norongarragalina meridionalis]|nr:Winged helix-turn-helix DNA-binding protein [Candidatus Norongarragalina meridionalis]